MLLREARAADVEEIAWIHRIAREHSMPWLPVLHTPRDVLTFFRDKVLPNQTVIVAEHRVSIAGFVAYDGDWLNHLYIAPRYFRQGIGGTLLWEVQSANANLNLWTFQKNSGARKFYARHGFDEAEFTDGASNEEKTPDVRMVWRRQ